MQDAEIKSPPRQTSFAKRNEAIERLKRRADAIRALGATSLYLFGSVAREETGPASDLDFIDSDPASRVSAFGLIGIKLFLEDESNCLSMFAIPDNPPSPVEGQDRKFRLANRLIPREVRHILPNILQAIAIIKTVIAGKPFADYRNDNPASRSGAGHLESQPRHSDNFKNARPEIARAASRRSKPCCGTNIMAFSDRIIWGAIVDERPKSPDRYRGHSKQVDEA
ncbi:nucleotidyltransferase family protein [Rhizobium mongolense]|uniref:nucleotidyltransferase family protein n=1 Tax=Rhizobium mongolense TaxID=57676 RepID=UPI0034A420C3